MIRQRDDERRQYAIFPGGPKMWDREVGGREEEVLTIFLLCH